MSRSRSVGMLEVAAGAALISFSPVFVRLADVGPTAAGVYRMAFGGAALLAFGLWSRGASWAGRRVLAVVVGCALLLSIDLAAWHHSIHYVGPGLSTILANFQVFVLAGVGVAVFGERAGWRLWTAVPLAIFGLVLLVGLRWSALEPRYQWGVVLGLLAAVTYAGFLLTLRHLRSAAPAMSPAAVMAIVSLATAALLVPMARLQGESLVIPDTRNWLLMLAYGLGPHAAGWTLIATGIPHVPASRVGLLLLLQPSLAFVWDIVFFARPTTIVEALGALIALSAIYLGTSRPQAA